ncbi:MAG: protease inhibitor I42 family protein [Methanoregula sp.]|nr:protease inhibitor I42 family protein [Methanoregula sp.]
MMHTTLLISLGMVCLLLTAVTFAGCTDTVNPAGPIPPRTPVGTPVPVGHLIVTEEQNKATVTVQQGSIITVRLPENPTTGYRWNLTTTPGLQVTGDTYVSSDTTGKLMGAGGTRIWEIKAAVPGEHKINAVYMRSWEPVSMNETGFSMTVIVN